MGTLFENYEQQYSVLTADVTAQIGLLGASATSNTDTPKIYSD